MFDGKLQVLHDALGLHTSHSRVQGAKLQAKHEVRIAAIFKDMPAPFLRMVVVHEFAHFKERKHDKAIDQLCRHMEPNYHHMEFDLRVDLRTAASLLTHGVSGPRSSLWLAYLLN